MKYPAVLVVCGCPSRCANVSDLEMCIRDRDYTGRKIILVTCHRRENYGQPMANIMTALRRVADAFPEVELVLSLIHI